MASFYDGINEMLKSSLNNDSSYYYDKDKRKYFDEYLDHYNNFIRDANNIDYEKSRKQTIKDLAKQFRLTENEAGDEVDSYMLRRNYVPIKKDARVYSNPKKWQTNRDPEEAYQEALALSKENPDKDVVFGLQYRNEKGNYGLKKPFLIGKNDYYKIYDSLNHGNNKTFNVHTINRRKKII